MLRKCVLLLASILVLIAHTPVWASPFDKLLAESLEYLKEVPEIEWIRFDEKNVILGWKGIPGKFTAVNRRAAVKASQATGHTVSIWSVRHFQKDYKVGRGTYICNTTADRGKVLTSSCR